MHSKTRPARLWFAGALAVALVAVPTAAFAHEEINPNIIVTGKPTFFTLSAANEKKVDLVKVTLAAPAGTNFGEATRSPAGWTANRGDTQIVWTGGAVKPDGFEQWGYEIEGADQPGNLKYAVTMGFADGSSEDASVVVAARAPAKGGGGGAVTPAVTALAKKAKSRANAALVLGALGVLGAIAALAMANRKRDATAVAAGDGADKGSGKDW